MADSALPNHVVHNVGFAIHRSRGGRGAALYPAQPRVSRPQSFASLFVVLAYLLAIFGSMDHPWEWFGLRSSGFTRYVPTIMMVICLIIYMITGGFLRLLRNPGAQVAVAFLSFEAAGAIIYAYMTGTPFDETYLGRALNGIAMLTGVIIAEQGTLREWVSRKIVSGAVIFGFVGVVLLTLHSLGIVLQDYNQIIRVQISYLMAGVAWYFIKRPSNIAILLIVIAMTANGYLSGKATHLIIGLIFGFVTVGRPYISRVFRLALHTSGRSRQTIFFFAISLFGGFLALAGSIFASIIRERASRHEYDVRRIGLEYRWEQFKDNPIFGKMFADSPNVSGIFSFGQNVPSHNDIMDILAAGGIVAILMYAFIIFFAIFGRGFLEFLTFRPNEIRPVHYFWLVTVFYLVAATGNPFFSEPYMAVPVWFSIGMMMGYRRSCPVHSKQNPALNISRDA